MQLHVHCGKENSMDAFIKSSRTEPTLLYKFKIYHRQPSNGCKILFLDNRHIISGKFLVFGMLCIGAVNH